MSEFNRLVDNERMRQIAKFGDQHHSLDRWLSILGEEVGELCKANNENDMKNALEELIQIAAVCKAIYEDKFVEPSKPVSYAVSITPPKEYYETGRLYYTK